MDIMQSADQKLLVPPRHIISEAIERALAEDIGYGDLTSQATIGSEARAIGRIIARASGVVAGLPVAAMVFSSVDPEIRFTPNITDGTRVNTNDLVATVHGPARSVLTAERVALNFLQQLSGVATLVREIVDETTGTKARLLDTRKTVPGLRALQRYAVRVGGGVNHRFNLFDGVLIKENHITVAGGITTAVMQARAATGPTTVIEVEVESLDQLDEAIAAGANMVLLDNMTPDQLRQAVAQAAGRVILEASGDISRDTARAVAESGVDYFSSGALTHSARALNLSLLLDPIQG